MRTYKLNKEAILYVSERRECNVLRYRRPGKDISLFSVRNMPETVIVGKLGNPNRITTVIEVNEKHESLIEILQEQIFDFTGINLEQWQSL